MPAGALRVFALGWFSCLWGDDCTAARRFFVTRRRAKTASRTGQELSRGVAYREEIIPVGPYRSTPCQHPWRRVSVRWQGVWSRSLTPVVDPPRLSARQVCERYRRRWRIEAAVALTTRLLVLADRWTGSTLGVQLPLDATLMFYAVRLMVCQQVAQALSEPLERISVAMVWCAFSHDSHAVQRGECDALVAFLAEPATRLGIVKRRRQQHRERQERESIMWGDP